jgi:serine/threonine protein kinase
MTEQLDQLKTALADRYRIERVAGRGGMATVYLAQDLRHDRRVAVKVLNSDLAAVLGTDRFLHEIRVTANLQHPHILPLHDSGEARGTDMSGHFLYYVMPFVDGESLRARMNRERVMDLSTTLAIIEEVADALSYAHRQGVVHRDVKPENVLLSEGHALVSDFGIAKAVTTASDEPLTRSGFPLGTPGYMSPEQAGAGSDLDERTDVYSLACVIYEMLIGVLPARWITEDELRQGRFLNAPPNQRDKLATLPVSVERALVRAMAIHPDARFNTPNELLHALTAPVPAARRYSDNEAREIINKAASLEASEPTGGHDFSLTGVRDIAREVDIPTRHVELAASALDQSMGRTPRILGIPAGTQIGRTVAGEVPETEYAALLEIIQDVVGEPGHMEAAPGGMFVWISARGREARAVGQVTRVQVSPRDGRTRITIMEDETTMIAMAAGVGAVVIGALVLPMSETWWALAPVAGAIVAGIGGLRIRWQKRRQLLSSLLDRLAGYVSTATRDN